MREDILAVILFAGDAGGGNAVEFLVTLALLFADRIAAFTFIAIATPSYLSFYQKCFPSTIHHKSENSQRSSSHSAILPIHPHKTLSSLYHRQD